MELQHIATREGRLSSFLKEEMGMSTGLMNRLKWQDKIFVNGLPQHTDYAVAVGDEICVLLDEPAPDYPAEEGELTVIYEDEHILAVDKPAGMLIHPSRATMTGTLANRVLFHFQRTNQKCAFHPITRLDRDTFGIVLLAKNAHIHALLSQGDLKKTYHALVFGTPPEKEGIIDAPIARRPLPSLLRYVSPEGKPSVTEYKVLECFEGYCRVELHPLTGRTHQLRVHCAHMGFPILGDPQYGGEKAKKTVKQGQLLCAKCLEFTHPITGCPLCLQSKLDAVL